MIVPFRLLVGGLVLLFGCGLRVSQANEVDFRRDILPLLSDRCFLCHGPDETRREAGLRLDQREAATAERNGSAAVVPGDPQRSELLSRVTHADLALRMPPVDSQRQPLTAQEVKKLRDWIAQGAPWDQHWAFVPPTRPSLPDSASHPIDAFILKKLREKGWQLAPEAPRHTLIRRLSYDLIGLPPTAEEVAALVADPSPAAYEAAVDRLLKSPHYGERMAMWWLDAARYADTDGYQGDATRTNWPWRDWVISAFNRNLRFDQFTLEQFAGDLLPDASSDQILATCFHRNHMTNGEGGRDPEESRVDYVIDRVNTVGTVWLGLTLGCAQCHAHKFDPISQQDYYRFFAFFNSIDEDGRAGSAAKPYHPVRSPHAERALIEAQQLVTVRQQREASVRAEAEQAFLPWLQQQMERVQQPFSAWHRLTACQLRAVEGTILTQEADGTIQASGPHPRQDDYVVVASLNNLLPAASFTAKADISASPGAHPERITGLQLEVFPHPSHTDGKLSRGASGEFILTDIKVQVRERGRSQVRDIELVSAIADVETKAEGRNYGRVQDTLDDDPRNGWTTETHPATEPHRALFALAEPLVLSAREELVIVLLQRSTRGDANLGRFRLSITDQPGPALRSLTPMPLEQLAASGAKQPDQISPELRQLLLTQFLAEHAAYQTALRDLQLAQQQVADCQRAAGELNVMVLKERAETRKTCLLKRGVWDQKGEELTAGLPAAILARPAANSRSRSDLARWLMDPQNPLTARVTVNHLWQLCFGAGLVRSPEDFGLQGDLPTHPELLDWLAVELVASGWDLQHLLRLIVTSQTYRQSSVVRPEMLQLDPENRLWARGARYRLPSWMVRDGALRVSGMLNPALGGPPIMPYQPDGVWEEMFMGRFRYQPTPGPAQYRRSLYTFWRRAAAPTFLFDSAQRRVCEVRPRLTNTPLHALTLLNDLTMLESARGLARHALRQDATAAERLAAIFHRVVAREPSHDELSVLRRELERALAHYQTDSQDAIRLLQFGQPEARPTDQPAELAAYLVTASLILNLDEAITHE